jgi:serine/threonine-protein kinase HipA
MVMTRKRQYQDLYVYMNAIRVGVLAREASGLLVFQYDQGWMHDESARPLSISMPLTEVPYKGQIVENYFDNLLPDSDVIRQRIQTRFNAQSSHCFDLLSSIGSDCVGAIQLLSQSEASDVKKIQAVTVTDSEIASLLKNYRTAPLGMESDSDFRISIAGAQEKTALLWHQNKWHLPHYMTPTSHIIKLPIGVIKHTGMDLSDSVENEWLCLKILAAYGLPVNDARMFAFADMKALVVERFDRRWSEDGSWLLRLPQEDMCQALGRPSALKYESDGGPGISDVMNVLLGSESATQDRDLFMRTVFLFWVLGAIDGHAKNFSISIGPQGRYKLTPIYDVMSAYPLVDAQQLPVHRVKMAMSLKGKNRHYEWKTIQLRHWLAMANKCQFSEEAMQSIIDKVFDRMESVIEQVSSAVPANFPQKIAVSIFSGMRKLRDKT